LTLLNFLDPPDSSWPSIESSAVLKILGLSENYQHFQKYLAVLEILSTPENPQYS
jgi:hypothetical protein